MRIVIIGGGPGGYVAAVRCAALGGQVTLVEMENLGGTCLNWGCIPSKIMKNSADLLAKCMTADKLGIRIQGPISADMTALMARKDKVLEDQRMGIATLMEKNGVEVIMGTARIAGNGQVEVSGKDGSQTGLEYDRLILAVGTAPLELSAFAFDHTRILSSNDMLCLERLPESMTIVGGGVIGCEFAFIFSALGCQVTLVEGMSRLLPLPSVDAACSKLLLREMKKRKIKVLCDTVVTRAQVRGRGVELSLAVSPFTDNPSVKPPKTKTLASEVMAVCIGRSPLSAGLGLETIGLETDKGGWIPVNDAMETAVENVYAIGDILGPDRIMLAHVASHEGLVAAENAMNIEKQKAVMAYDAVPSAIFTMPEIATVGLSEQGAQDRGIAVETASVNFRILGKAQAIDEIAGEAKMIMDAESHKVLGVHLIGAHATDLIAEATLAIEKAMTAEEIAHTIHAHPTLAEIMGEVAAKAAGTAIYG